jgi:hypothetical protein
LRRTLISRLGVVENIAELANGHRRANLVARYKRTKRGRPVSRPSKKFPHISARCWPRQTTPAAMYAQAE